MAINADWEKFLDGPIKSIGREPRVTISDRGVIVFNGLMFDRLSKPEAVALFYNRREQKIGVEPTDPRFNEAFHVHRVRSDAATRYISASSFCIHFSIDVTGTHKFLRPEIDAQGRLILNLNETILVTRVREKRAKSIR